MESVIMKITAGSGEEAALFVSDLFRMYTRYADSQRMEVDFFSSQDSDYGGFKEITFSISGDLDKTIHLYNEYGIHMNTENSTFTKLRTTTFALVEVWREPNVGLNMDEVKLETFRNGFGAGVYTKQTIAYRATHIPTNIVVSCEDSVNLSIIREHTLRLLLSRINSDFNSDWDSRKRRKYIRDPYKSIRDYVIYQDVDNELVQRVLDGELNLVWGRW